MIFINLSIKNGTYGNPPINVTSEKYKYNDDIEKFNHSLSQPSSPEFFIIEFRNTKQFLFTHKESNNDLVCSVECFFKKEAVEPIIFGLVTKNSTKKYFRFNELKNSSIFDTSNFIKEEELDRELKNYNETATPADPAIASDVLDIDYNVKNRNYTYKSTTICYSYNNFSNKYSFVEHKYSSNNKITQGAFSIRYKDSTVNFEGDVSGEYCNQVLVFEPGKDPETPILLLLPIDKQSSVYILYADFVKNNGKNIKLSSMAKISTNVDNLLKNNSVEGELLNLLYKTSLPEGELLIINTDEHASYKNVIVTENQRTTNFKSYTHAPSGAFIHTIIECLLVPLTLKDYDPSNYGHDNLQYLVMYYGTACSTDIPLLVEIVTNNVKLQTPRSHSTNNREYYCVKSINQTSEHHPNTPKPSQWSVTYGLTDLNDANIETKLNELSRGFATPMKLITHPKQTIGALRMSIYIFLSATLLGSLAFLIHKKLRNIVKMTRGMYRFH